MKSVKLLAAAIAGTVGCAAGAASAQPPWGPPPWAQPQPTYSWTGPYVGLNFGWDSPETKAGVGAAKVNQTTGLATGSGGTATVPPSFGTTSPMDFSNSTAVGGLDLGYNRQMGRYVLGVEGDLEDQGAQSYGQSSGYTLPATALTTGSGVAINRYTVPALTATIRGRAGMVFGRTLVYATGGLAIADVRQEADYIYAPFPTRAAAAANPASAFGPFQNFASQRQVLVGWTLGAGAEWRINRAISIGAEYRHLDFGSSNFVGGAFTGPNGVSEVTRLSYGDDQVLAKLNFHF